MYIKQLTLNWTTYDREDDYEMIHVQYENYEHFILSKNKCFYDVDQIVDHFYGNVKRGNYYKFNIYVSDPHEDLMYTCDCEKCNGGTKTNIDLTQSYEIFKIPHKYNNIYMFESGGFDITNKFFEKDTKEYVIKSIDPLYFEWKYKRLLVIASKKPNENCNLTKLPFDIIKLVMGFVDQLYLDERENLEKCDDIDCEHNKNKIIEKKTESTEKNDHIDKKQKLL
jgi:hypothetical protein